MNTSEHAVFDIEREIDSRSRLSTRKETQDNEWLCKLHNTERFCKRAPEKRERVHLQTPCKHDDFACTCIKTRPHACAARPRLRTQEKHALIACKCAQTRANACEHSVCSNVCTRACAQKCMCFAQDLICAQNFAQNSFPECNPAQILDLCAEFTRNAHVSATQTTKKSFQIALFRLILRVFLA